MFVLAQGVLVLTRVPRTRLVRPAMLPVGLLGVLHLVALARFSDTLDWDTAGAWIYLGFLLSVLAVGGYGSWRVLSRRGARGGTSTAH